MQCLFIGKVLCEDFEIHMLNLCSEIKVYDKVSEVSKEEVAPVRNPLFSTSF